MARWRAMVDLAEEYPDAGQALEAACWIFGPRVVRVVSVTSDEINEGEARQRARLRHVPRRFVDTDEEE